MRRAKCRLRRRRSTADEVAELRVTIDLLTARLAWLEATAVRQSMSPLVIPGTWVDPNFQPPPWPGYPRPYVGDPLPGQETKVTCGEMAMITGTLSCGTTKYS